MPRKKNLLLFESKVHERVVVSRSTVMLLVGRLSGLAHPEFGGQIQAWADYAHHTTTCHSGFENLTASLLICCTDFC